MEGKVIIITKQQTDQFLIKYLAALGFPEGEIEICADSTEVITTSTMGVQLVLFQADSYDDTALIGALCRRFAGAAVILLAEHKDEQHALQLLQYGVQDYMLHNNLTFREFKKIAAKAISRKQFSLRQEGYSHDRAEAEAISNKMEEYNFQLLDEVQTQKRKLDHILSSINEVVWSCTADNFEPIYINDACFQIYGYKPEEIIGNCDLLFGRVHHEDKKHFKIAWRELLRYGKSIFEYQILHKDGTLRYIKNEAVLRRDKNNAPQFINGFARDVTIQKTQFLKIQKQNEQLREIAWIQSHSVRGPVATILGLVHLFNIKTADADNTEIISHIEAATNQLDLIIKDIVSRSAIGIC